MSSFFMIQLEIILFFIGVLPWWQYCFLFALCSCLQYDLTGGYTCTGLGNVNIQHPSHWPVNVCWYCSITYPAFALWTLLLDSWIDIWLWLWLSVNYGSSKHCHVIVIFYWFSVSSQNQCKLPQQSLRTSIHSPYNLLKFLCYNLLPTSCWYAEMVGEVAWESSYCQISWWGKLVSSIPSCYIAQNFSLPICHFQLCSCSYKC